MEKDFFIRLEKARASREYKNYLEVREYVFMMLDNAPVRMHYPSAYWGEELSGFMYMLDASPLMIQKLRHQTYHLTGLFEYNYRVHHGKKLEPLRKKLGMLKALDSQNLLIPEAPELGGFGYSIDNALCNIDTLKFYEVFIGLEISGILKSVMAKDYPIILEIGAGWGGFAYQWKKLFPKSTYCIVDFPEVILFSATYIKTLFPDAKILLADGTPESVSGIIAGDYDFIFIPHYAWERVSFEAPDLLVNMASFQEMTTDQVKTYVRKAAALGIANIYSLNRNRSPYNSELTNVSDILSERYECKPVEVLPMQYTEFPSIEPPTLFGRIKKIYQYMRWGNRMSIHAYRHYAGALKQ